MRFTSAVFVGAFLLALSPLSASVEKTTLSARFLGTPLLQLSSSADDGDDQQSLSDVARTVANELATALRLLETLARFINNKNDESAASESTAEASVKNVLTNRAEADKSVSQHLFGLTVPIEIGSPGQHQDVLLSFFSSHFWVVSSRVTFSHLIKNCFNESKSKTLDKSAAEKFKLKLSEYSASGQYIQDDLKIGAFEGKKLRVGVADSVSYIFPLLRINGVLGLTSSDEGDALRELLQNARDQYLTLYHNPLANVLSNATNAIMATFGGWDEDLCEDDWKSVKATRNPYWQVTVDGINIGNSEIREETDGKAMLASTLPLTFLPHSTFAQIAFELGAVELKDQTGVYMLRCWSLPTIHLRINGKLIPLTPENYTIKMAGLCFLRLMAISQSLTNALGVDYVLAEPMLRSNCVRFAPATSQLGFATPKPQQLVQPKQN